MTTLTWKQSTGECIMPDGEVWFRGYAGGHAGQAPEAVNNPDMDHVRNVGPLPRGRYLIGPLVDAAHPEPPPMPKFDPKRYGPNYLRLTPEPSNNMHERGGFLMHWDRGDRLQHPHSASDGCIIPEEGAFIALVAQHAGEWLEVVA